MIRCHCQGAVCRWKLHTYVRWATVRCAVCHCRLVTPMIRWATVRCAVCLCRLVHTYDQVSHCQVCCVSLKASTPMIRWATVRCAVCHWRLHTYDQVSHCQVCLCHCRLETALCAHLLCDQVSHCQVCYVFLQASAHLWSGEPLSGVLCVTEGCTPVIRWATVRCAVCHCRLVHTYDQVSHCQLCCVSLKVHTYDQVSHCQVCCVSLQASTPVITPHAVCFSSAHLWSGEPLSGVLCVFAG